MVNILFLWRPEQSTNKGSLTKTKIVYFLLDSLSSTNRILITILPFNIDLALAIKKGGGQHEL